ncbi:MAG: primase DnaG/twinkle, TOPRIM domain [Caudoviricetes sp.]|nr:MAG: primase DnaG/twinkle, TOPRIM domain [Caudoviricetes sp.]
MSDFDDNDNEAALLYKGSCELCGSSDARAVYSDGHSFCFACPDEKDAWQPPSKDFMESIGYDSLPVKRYNSPQKGGNYSVQHNEQLWSMDDHAGLFRDLTARGLTAETCKKYGYWVGRDNKGSPVQVANYRGEDGSVVSQKIRYPDKTFFVIGKHKVGQLYGSHLWNVSATSKFARKIVITEGEIDMMVVDQLFGGKQPVVSLGHGAASARKTCAAAYQYLDQYDEIILMFDMDDAGRNATEEAAKVLPAGKVRVAVLPFKDADECVKEGHGEAVRDQVWNAKRWSPPTVVSAMEMKERTRAKLEVLEKGGIPFANFEGINDKTQGMWDGDVIMVTAGSGMGKSTFCLQVMSWLHEHRPDIIKGLVILEADPETTILDMMGMANKCRIRQTPELREAIRTDGRYDKWYDELFNSDRLFLYDGFAESDTNILFESMRYMHTVHGVKLFLIDHVSIIASASEESDERKMLDKLMTELKKFAVKYGVVIMVVCHLKNPPKGKAHEEGRQVSITDLRGSGSLRQLSDTIIAGERNQQGDNPNYMLFRGLKGRLCGDTGLIDAATYNKETGLFEPAPIVVDNDEQPEWEEHKDDEY